LSLNSEASRQAILLAQERIITVADAVNYLSSIQQEYFTLLEECRLYREYLRKEGNHFVLNKNIDSRHQIVMLSQDGWKPSVIDCVEELFESIHRFWLRKQEDLNKSLLALKEDFIHVGDKGIELSGKRYGVLFEGLFVSDQFLMKRRDYLPATSVPDWQSLVVDTLRTLVNYLSHKELFVPPNGKPFALIVPASICLSQERSQQVTDVSFHLTTKFVSELCDRSFSDLGEYFSYLERAFVPTSKLNQDVLKLIFHRSKANGFAEYRTGVASLMQGEQGVDWWKQDPVYRVLVYDAAAQFSEFERFASDAYLWGQEPEIPEWDLPMYEWWFNNTAQECGKALGSRHSEGFLCKLAVNSSELGFLSNVRLDELMELRKQDFVYSLRNDLNLCRARLRRSDSMSLSNSMDEVGAYVAERLRQFDAELHQARKSGAMAVAKNVGKFVATAGLTLASAVFPPLSLFSLLWSGSLAELYQVERNRRQTNQDLLMKPLASLISWKGHA
jgi:hypothetical protein